MWNVRGTVSPDQLRAQIEAEAQAQVKASGGRITLPDAQAKARQAIEAQLIRDNAHPSQASVASAVTYAATGSTDPGDLLKGMSTLLRWALLGGVGLAAILIIKD